MAMVEKKNSIDVFMFLPLLAVCVDLFTPYLIWKNILPAEIRWVSHIALVAIILMSFVRMLSFDLIPFSFFIIVFISILWSYVAIDHGQAIVPTIWGIWELFQFPFVFLFMYLQPEPPRRLPEYLRTLCLIVLSMEVAAQLLQFVFGEIPGDDLAGFFGKNGTANAVLFIILVCCMFFGHWIASRQWRRLLIALSLGMLSSLLGEMKLFPLAIVIIGLVGIILYASKYRAPGKMIIYLTLIILIVASFVTLYNIIIPRADESPIQTYVTDPTRLLNYLTFARSTGSGVNKYTNMGRLYALTVGWDSLQKDLITFLFGYGIGTRNESKTLGTIGVALLSGSLGLNVGTSLLVIMQEMGFIGLVLVAGFLLWILLTLVRDIRTYPESPAVGLRYGLFIFSILWPLWLFYSKTWTMRVPMLLYWLTMGYVFAESRIMRKKTKVQPHGSFKTGG